MIFKVSVAAGEDDGERVQGEYYEKRDAGGTVGKDMW